MPSESATTLKENNMPPEEQYHNLERSIKELADGQKSLERSFYAMRDQLFMNIDPKVPSLEARVRAVEDKVGRIGSGENQRRDRLWAVFLVVASILVGGAADRFVFNQPSQHTMDYQRGVDDAINTHKVIENK